MPPGPCILGLHISHAEHVNRDIRRILAGEIPLERRQEFPAVLVPPVFCLAGAPIGHSKAVRRSCDRKFHAAGNLNVHDKPALGIEPGPRRQCADAPKYCPDPP